MKLSGLMRDSLIFKQNWNGDKTTNVLLHCEEVLINHFIKCQVVKSWHITVCKAHYICTCVKISVAGLLKRLRPHIALVMIPCQLRPLVQFCCFQGLRGCFSSRGLSAQAELQQTLSWPLVYTSLSFQINITARETEAGKQSKAAYMCRTKICFI